MSEIDRRRAYTSGRFKELKQALPSAADRIGNKACVYATGSFGRLEASSFSDLDLFIVGKWNGKDNKFGADASELARLDDIQIKADLIVATRDLKIPDFDGDGRYLVHYSVHDFTKSLGTPEDDALNTFTGRLLMLLESKPLLGEDTYNELIAEIVEKYWGDFEDHRDDFTPTFLANDILRLWRTFCVNYEVRTSRIPEEKKAKRKVKNYKLKHSRLLTCYSAIIYLLAVHALQNSVTPDDAISMSKLTPIERLQWVATQSAFKDSSDSIANTIQRYDQFLQNANRSEAELTEKFKDKANYGDSMESAKQFGDSVATIIEKVGKNSPLKRMILV